MTDEKTAEAYTKNATAYSRDWLAQPPPADMYALLDLYFHKKGRTADIGCGNGRDAQWLALQGHDVTGYDAAGPLLAEARALFPNIPFKTARLPGLDEISDVFDNVLCETVLMHLPARDIPPALASLRRILQNGGVLYLSWRVTPEKDTRHADGRLYSAFSADDVRRHLTDCEELHFEEKTSASSGKAVCRLIVRKISP